MSHTIIKLETLRRCPLYDQVVIVVDEIVWTGNLGTSILRVQQAGANAVKDEKALEGRLEALPQEGDVAAEGLSSSAVQTFLDYSLEQIEAMIDLVRGDLDRYAFSLTENIVIVLFSFVW